MIYSCRWLMDSDSAESGGAKKLPSGALSTVTDSGSGLRTVIVNDSATLTGTGSRFYRIRITSP